VKNALYNHRFLMSCHKFMRLVYYDVNVIDRAM